ncbi:MULTISPECIES: hypothetical protein [Brevundimonas]|uniref:hypothetical protein n=1 Tax=Brevundimonas TaxID=41275 RepID=UPI000F020E53|nr:hypothetical protein [Brevundimonas lutea]
MDTDPLQSPAGRATTDAAPDAGLSREVQAREAEISTPNTVSASRPVGWLSDTGSGGDRLGAWI